MVAHGNPTGSRLDIDAESAFQVEWIILQLLDGGDAFCHFFFDYLSTQPMWVAGVLAIRLAELTTGPDPERSRQAANVLATFAERLGVRLKQGLRNRDHYYREHCQAALNVCMPDLTDAR